MWFFDSFNKRENYCSEKRENNGSCCNQHANKDFVHTESKRFSFLYSGEKYSDYDNKNVSAVFGNDLNMVRHVEKSVVCWQVVKSEKGSQSSLLFVGDWTRLFIYEPGLDLTIYCTEKASTPDKNTGELELFIPDASICLWLDMRVFCWIP